MPSPKKWSDLTAVGKKRHQNKGITPGPYNRWMAMTPKQRKQITEEAKQAGYDSGLIFTTVQAQVRRKTGKRITTKTPANRASTMLLRGTPKKDPLRKLIPKWFSFREFERVDWISFLSP